MPKFAANLTTMFNELPAAERFAAARACGFEAVEYLNPYGDPATEVRGWLDATGLEMILLNTSPGDAANGERGVAALPGREDDFDAIFGQALEYAEVLGAGMIHVMAGVVPAGVPKERCEAVFVANLQRAAERVAESGIRLLLEPLNTVDVPGYLHTSSADTCRLLAAIDRPNVLLQYDFYHLQIMQGNLAAGLESHFDVIGHVQFSSVPGRHEPPHGEVNLPFLFDRLDEIGYAGWVGCEYRPKTTTLEGLGWAAPYGIRAESTPA